MIRKLFLATFALLCLSHSPMAQSQVYKVQQGQSLMGALPVGVSYIYPEFRQGQVQFRNGNVGGARMNYSPLLQEMDFITDKNDTMALADMGAIRYIAIGADTFYHLQKFMIQQIANNGEIRLAERRAVNLANREAYGGHGEVQSGTSIQAIEQLSSGVNTMRQMVAKQVLSFSLDKTYYFGDRFGNFRLANRKNLLDAFGKQYPGLDDFLAQQKVNYFKADDMKLVLEFLSIDEQKKK